MGGSGGGGAFVNRSPEELRKLVRRAEEETTIAAFETDLSELLGNLLASYNGRDVTLVADRLSQLKSALEGSTEEVFDQLFGGSVAKHTYVDGLSDIDSLVVINDTGLESRPPQDVLEVMAQTIVDQADDNVEVASGRMAVTVSYADGMQIQLLPAIRTDGGLMKVPSSRRDGWSEIDPMKFKEALTKRNQECGGKLIPMIKLAKAINGQLPETQQLSGYHMESLAIAAFKGYQGQRTAAAMLPVFFERARDLLLSPIVDRTGQSVHVDTYLGPANSEARQAVSHVFGRVARRMRNASAAASKTQWQALFGIEP